MNDTIMYVGSLSNDLFRVANLSHRGSYDAAKRFLKEAKRWAEPLKSQNVAPYIRDIAKDISKRQDDDILLESSERYLMYGILLQNFTAHHLK